MGNRRFLYKIEYKETNINTYLIQHIKTRKTRKTRKKPQ